MTDVQLLLAIKLRTAQRPSNFQFIQLLDNLLVEARLSTLEKPIIEKLVRLLAAYGVGLDDTDIETLNRPGRGIVIESNRLLRLKDRGFTI